MAAPATLNFGAGPAMIPRNVLEKAQADLLNYGGTGMSVMELSHRSKEFEAILAAADKDLRTLMDIPDNYKVLFLQGGATTQFSAVLYNFIGRKRGGAENGHAADDWRSIPVDYIVTGGWSDKAAKEAQRLGAKVNIVLDTKKQGYSGVPPPEQWKLSGPSAAYVYYCSNETVHGVEFQNNGAAGQEGVFPGDVVDPSVPLVCDMSSNILSRPLDVSRFALIYFGAQKNVGPSGLTVVVVRSDLLDATHPGLVPPIMLEYKTAADNTSMYNTPPTFAIYVSGLVFKDLIEKGGIAAVDKVNEAKAKKLYGAIEASNGFYRCVVKEGFRSRMNVPFRIYGSATEAAPSADLESKFLKGALQRNMQQLPGHRSVGGIRASIYNAMPLAGVEALCAYMEEFAKANAKA
ncbi:phosphoserine aminotransferase [Hyaloraphidium curvatum]|nr:phosphoserine aminotransferase [Hyaloraphidium curvatum]